MHLFDIFKKPLAAGIAGGVIGLVIGLIFAWMVWPVTWTDASPAALSPDHKAEYLRMAVDSFALNQNTDLAKNRIEYIGAAEAAQILDTIVNNPGSVDPGAAMRLRDGARDMAGNPQTQPQPGETPSGNNGEETAAPAIFSNPITLGAIGILLLAIMVGGIYYFYSHFIRGRRPASPEDYSPARQAQEITRAAAEAKTDFSKLGLQEPTSRTMTTYVLGDDLYDESFSIDAQNGEFLGEYGVGVSEAIGVGDPKKVTAIEIWLFDKNDIKTATKVLMTPNAFNDQVLRNKLEAKGELVQLEPHGQVLLETQTLQLLATVVDLEFGQGNLPAKSYFDRITLELAVWPK